VNSKIITFEWGQQMKSSICTFEHSPLTEKETEKPRQATSALE